GERLMSAVELVEFVAKSLVDEPDAVQVELIDEGDGRVIELRVAEGDMGKVIGRNGSVAKAMRTLLKVVSAREGESVSLEIV
ncbi:MAG TPA: KH domain-containing protein, partial [Candidatus Limnocylindrales bacterium]|nr:KH domain-containing protein [Candidatus Limnocylindrales bacterium]